MQLQLLRHDCLVVQTPCLILKHLLNSHETVSNHHDQHGHGQDAAWDGLEGVVSLEVDVDGLAKRVLAFDRVNYTAW